jgi:hypothetical protein
MTPVNYLFHRHGCVLVSLEQGLDFDSPVVSKFIDLASEQGAIDFEEAPTSSEEHQQYLVHISALSNFILVESHCFHFPFPVLLFTPTLIPIRRSPFKIWVWHRDRIRGNCLHPK